MRCKTEKRRLYTIRELQGVEREVTGGPTPYPPMVEHRVEKWRMRQIVVEHIGNVLEKVGKVVNIVG